MKQYDFQLIVGLGNPGRQYEGTYHNAGKDIVRALVSNKNFKRPFSIRDRFLFEYLREDFLTYIIPLVYMNESGRAVFTAMQRFNIIADKTLIIHDDTDIETGTYKLSYGRGSAGHNGVQSIIRSLGTKNFWRLRIGIGGASAKKAGEFVLQKISEEDRKKIEKTLLEIQTSYFK